MLSGRQLPNEGELRLIWNGKTLDLNRPLPEQGVRPRDLLRLGYAPQPSPKRPARIFVSYSHQDSRFLDEL
jgi:hypothetical protein